MSYQVWYQGGQFFPDGHGLFCLCFRCRRPRNQPDTDDEADERTADEGITTNREALETLEALRATESQLSTTQKGKVALQIKALEKWLKRHASSEPKRLAMAFCKGSFDAFKALATSLTEHKSLGRAFTSAVGKLEKARALKAELKALGLFQEASAVADFAAAESAFTKLAHGALQMTVYGRRAKEHLQALSDDYGS